MTNQSQDKFSEWKKALVELLASNQVTVAGHRYTRPAPSTYEHQWLWDSCFHAIAYRWIDPEMAWSELLSVTSHQVKEGADAGMIPHMVYWGGGGQELWLHADRSTITQPPLIGVAAWLVHTIAPDRSKLAVLYPLLTAFHNWFDRRRDPDRDHLVCLIHPWEAGSDSSPRWDRAMKLPERFPPSAGTAARKSLVGVLNKYGHDPLALAESGYFCVETIDFNAIRAADLEALANIAAELGLPGDSSGWLEQAKEVQHAVQAKLMQPAPHDLEGLEEIPITVDSASHFIALFGGCATLEQAGKMVQRLQQPDYWTAYPVPTSPISSPLICAPGILAREHLDPLQLADLQRFTSLWLPNPGIRTGSQDQRPGVPRRFSGILPPNHRRRAGRRRSIMDRLVDRHDCTRI